MKRFYQIKKGEFRPGDYDAEARRNYVEPDFSFTEKGIPSKQSLNYQAPEIKKNNRGTSEDFSKIPVSKKIKTNKGSVILEKDKENISPNSMIVMEKYEKMKAERDELQEKLKVIENFVTSTKKTDSVILKNIRDYLGMSMSNMIIMNF